jgi:hypothetical protein
MELLRRRAHVVARCSPCTRHTCTVPAISLPCPLPCPALPATGGTGSTGGSPPTKHRCS